MNQNLQYLFNQLTSRLWFRPLVFCLISIGAALLAHLADNSFLVDIIPKIEKNSLDDLLTTISSSMLVIAIFAVGSMISAFSAASGTATPRSFELIVADDVSQNALSVYIGSFIFSIVAAIALKNGYYGEAGYFTLFVLTLLVFALVILTFLKWVERIAKLGRLGHTIQKVEEATKTAMSKRLLDVYMGGNFISDTVVVGTPMYSKQIGYVQHINMEMVQEFAKKNNVNIILKCLPGTFISADKPLATITNPENNLTVFEEEKLTKAFIIDNNRSYHDDPLFGIVALTEIASRALSPGINDPGTAIAIIDSHIRLFTLWAKGNAEKKTKTVKYDKVMVPIISLTDMFNDAFRPIARDGANNIEVMLKLQNALVSISNVGNDEIKSLASEHSKQAFDRAEIMLDYKHDLELLRRECLFNN